MEHSNQLRIDCLAEDVAVLITSGYEFSRFCPLQVMDREAEVSSDAPVTTASSKYMFEAMEIAGRS